MSNRKKKVKRRLPQINDLQLNLYGLSPAVALLMGFTNSVILRSALIFNNVTS